MNNEEEIIRLGFIENPEGKYRLEGKFQVFIAEEITCNGPVYVKLYYESKEIDNRPLSNRKGLPYINYIKDCISPGSLEKSILKYDVEDKYITHGGWWYKIDKKDNQ